MPLPKSFLIGLLAVVAFAACNSAPPPAPPPPRPTAESPAPGSPAAEPPSPESDGETAAPEEIEPPPLMPFGVSECDKFVEKYVACVDLRVPPAEQEKKMNELREHRARWRELGKMDQGKVAMGLSCRGVAQRLKADLILDYGCEFQPGVARPPL